MRPCAVKGCGTPTRGTRCDAHQRRTHLARDVLPWLIARDRNVCQICNEPTGGRGQGGQYASIDHADGDPSNNDPRNLLLAHQLCNTNKQHTPT